MCAGITLKTFSERELVPAISDWEEAGDRFPKTGLKVGIHSGVLAVKKVGITTLRREWQDPVWAGRPVNWAFKCAQAADAHELVATESVYSRFANNDYITYSCGCDGKGNRTQISYLWSHFEVGTLPRDKAPTKVLRTCWCQVHGDTFCDAVMSGETTRPEVTRSIA